MIDATPDMPDAGAQVLDERRPGRGMLKFEHACRGGTAQHRGLHRSMRTEREQAPMRWVGLAEHAILDAQAPEHIAAVGSQRQPQVIPIDPLVDLQWAKTHFTSAVGCGQAKRAEHVGLQCSLTGAQLAPSDFAIAVAVQADRELAVADGEFQCAVYL